VSQSVGRIAAEISGGATPGWRYGCGSGISRAGSPRENAVSDDDRAPTPPSRSSLVGDRSPHAGDQEVVWRSRTSQLRINRHGRCRTFACPRRRPSGRTSFVVARRLGNRGTAREPVSLRQGEMAVRAEALGRTGRGGAPNCSMIMTFTGRPSSSAKRGPARGRQRSEGGGACC